MPDCRIVRCTYAITADPVTKGIEKYLPWLDQIGKFPTNPIQSVATLPVFEQLQIRNLRPEPVPFGHGGPFPGMS
jgi:hypothetical protein